MTARTATISLVDVTQDESEARKRVPKNRVQFDLPPRSMERLNALKFKTEASSYAEVL